MNRIVSSSLVACEYEKNYLLIKLHSEYEIVSEFIFIESMYNTHGNLKGFCLDKILAHEDFAPFRDKITVLSNPESFYPANAEYSEWNNILCEFNSRAYCWDYVCTKYADDDWLIMEDADELLWLDRPVSRDLLLREFNTRQCGMNVWSSRFWWDFSNIAPSYEKHVPCHKIGQLKEREYPFHHRNNHCPIFNPDVVCSVEYSHCASAADNWLKVNISAHDKYTQDVMEKAYRYNTWHKSPLRGEKLNYPLDFFEMIDLDENNSPQFVLDNIDTLRVNTIDPDYAVHRVNELGLAYPHPCEQFGLMRGNKINRKYHYMRRK